MSEQVFGIGPGDIIQDSYEITALLGEGGMGATFSGRNLATDHPVAIKVMTAEFSRNKKALDLFRRESSLLRTVQHEAVIRYETTLQDAQGRLFLVMEFIDGHPLSYYVKKGARLDDHDVLKLGKRLAGGLAAIHKLGIVHRDIAPDNILVPQENVQAAKLIDFGLASDTVGSEKSIIGDSIAGKFSYMSPEQLGLFGGKVSAASDIYALGLVLCRIAGCPVPGEGMGVAAIDARRVDINLEGNHLSPPLRTLLEHMLRADPADRPTDIVALFEAALSGEQPTSIPTPKPKPGNVNKPEPPQRSRLPLALAGVVAVAVIAVSGYFALPMLTQDDPFANSGGGSGLQSERAEEALEDPAPILAVKDLIAQGDIDSLNAAFGALIALGNDKDQPSDLRQTAYVMAAQMYDPQTHDTKTSPFPNANPRAAVRTYQKAADLGSNAARQAIDRLGE